MEIRVPYNWNDFLVQEAQYFIDLTNAKEEAEEIAKIPDSERRRYIDVLFSDNHTIDRHVDISQDEMLERVVLAPPILNEEKEFSSFFSEYDFRLTLADLISNPRTSKEVFKWLTSDKTKKERIGDINLKYGFEIGKSIRFSNNKILESECENVKLIITRDKNAMTGQIENPYFFKIITAYPIRGIDAVEEINKDLTKKFSDKLIEMGEKDIGNRLAWGLILLNTEIIKIDSNNNILFDGKSEINIKDKVFGVIKVQNSNDFIGVNVSERGKQELVYGNVESGRVYPLPESKKDLFKEEIELITLKMNLVWNKNKFECLVDNKILGYKTIPEYDREVKFLSENKWPPLTSDIDEITNREYDDNNKDTDNRITEQTKEQDDERTED